MRRTENRDRLEPERQELEEELFGHVLAVAQQFLMVDTSRAARRHYRQAVKRWTIWAQPRGYTALPASAGHLAEYFEDNIQKGECFGTMRVYAVAIAMYHRWMGLDNPVRGPALLTLERHGERSGDDPGMIDGLRHTHLMTIMETARRHCRMKGDCEAPLHDYEIGPADIALLSVMRDARLHATDAAVLLWTDITEEPDGSGVVTVRCTNNDPEDDIIRPVPVETMQALREMEPACEREGKVFGLDECRIDARIRDIALLAGLDGNFNGDSPRLGKSLDHVLAGLGFRETAVTSRLGVETPATVNSALPAALPEKSIAVKSP